MFIHHWVAGCLSITIPSPGAADPQLLAEHLVTHFQVHAPPEPYQSTSWSTIWGQGLQAYLAPERPRTWVNVMAEPPPELS